MENKFYIVRAESAGVFFGNIKETTGTTITMTNVRKLWYWEGACGVEQLAMDGVKKPGSCKFTVVVPEMTIANPIQIIPCTDNASKVLAEVPVWKS